MKSNISEIPAGFVNDLFDGIIECRNRRVYVIESGRENKDLTDKLFDLIFAEPEPSDKLHDLALLELKTINSNARKFNDAIQAHEQKVEAEILSQAFEEGSRD